MNNLSWKYVKPLRNEQCISAFENKYNINIPQELKKCIFKNNGGRPNLKVYDTNKSSGRVIKTLLSYNEEDIENIYNVLPLLKKENMFLLPFASDPSGNFICVNLLNNDEIVLWIHEVDSVEYIAKSFAKFLEILYN